MPETLPVRRISWTMIQHEYLLATNVSYRNKRISIEKNSRKFARRAMARDAFRIEVIEIPVVVHVVFNKYKDEQNISDEQIQSQIKVLNEDYRKMNSDLNKVPLPFQPRIGDAGIQFRLADKDPNNNPTNGITRTPTEMEFFEPHENPVDDEIKFTAKGGHDAWPCDKYLNLWVCPLVDVPGNKLLGYATFPGYPPEVDGVAITYDAFGTIGTAKRPFDKGRTATHEIGHWLNLFHIWGDALCGNDDVADTPTQARDNSGCPSFPHVTCGNGPDGDMFMNFMDYVNDACMQMFTTGQTVRMQATLEGPRKGIAKSVESPIEPPEPEGINITANPNLVIPDIDPAGVNSTIEVEDSGVITQIVVMVDIEHPYTSDLKVSLTDPEGNTIILQNKVGGVVANIVKSFTVDNTPDMAVLLNEEAKGKWTLNVADTMARDIGNFRRWGIHLKLST